MKITDYEKVQALAASNIFLLDGPNGTKTPSTISSGGIGSDVTFPESCINSCHSCSTVSTSST